MQKVIVNNKKLCKYLLCISQSVPEKQNQLEILYIYHKVFIWLTWLQRLRRPWPAVCKLETQKGLQCSFKTWEPESRWHRFQSESQGLRIRSVDGLTSMFQLSHQVEVEFNLPLPCSPVQALNRLHDAHPREGHLLSSTHQFKC